MNPGPHRKNNFDFMRQVAALLVVFGHSQAMLGLPHSALWGTRVSSFGVLIFFSISGYLIAQSWTREPNLLSFFCKRALRIFPALIAAVFFCALVIGPLATRLSLSEYIHNAHLRFFFLNCFLYIWYFLPGVFEGNPIPSAVDGSLWSLPVEFFCYIVLCLLCMAPGRSTSIKFLGSTLAIGAIVLGLSRFYRGPQLVVYATDLQHAASVMPFFFVGAFLQSERNRIALRLDVALLGALVLFAIEGFGFPQILMVACWFVLPYGVLAFGSASTPVLRRWGRFGDFSYGMYLYAFPIQQWLVQHAHGSLGLGGLVASATALSLGAAFLSWHLVEKPALGLKPAKASVEAVDEPAAVATDRTIGQCLEVVPRRPGQIVTP